MAGGIELGEPRILAPADEDVALRQHLHVALASREQALRVYVRAHEADLACADVDAQQQCARFLLDGRVGAVVEQGDRVARLPARVVLPVERRRGTHREVAPLAAQPPTDRSGAPVDVVERVGVSAGDEVVPVRPERDRVDVEVVERLRASRLRVRLRKRDVGERAPLEQHPATRDRELLEAGVPGLAALVVIRDQRGVPRRDREFVLVAGEPVSGFDDGNPAVLIVVDHVVAAADPVRRFALPPGEHLAAAVALDTKIGRALRLWVEPDRPAAAVDDQRPLRPDLLGRDEDVARCGRLAFDVDRDEGGHQVRTRDEVHERRIRRRASRVAVRGPGDGEADERKAENFSQRSSRRRRAD